jgi:siroheme synthase-like protein
MPISTFPLVLTNLSTARCVVVGGGAVAERKARQLLDAGACPTVISPTLSAALVAWHRDGRIAHIPRLYREGDLEAAALVFAATNDAEANQQVVAEARRRGILANVADAPATGSFHTVSTLRRGDLLITVSTGGASPALAAQIRDELAERYGPEYADCTQVAAAQRPKGNRP